MKKLLVTISALIISVIPCLCTTVHNFHVSYSGSNGLNDPNIACCCQDRYGRLWIATSEGIYFYTGNEFKRFNNPEFRENCSKMTFKVATDGDGCIWIITRNGFGYFNPYTNEFKMVGDEPARQKCDIAFDSKGTVWLGIGNKIFNYDKEKDKLSTILTAMSRITDICMYGDNLLFTDEDGSIYSYSTKSGITEAIRSPFLMKGGEKIRYNGIAFIDNCHILTSTSNGKFLILDINTGIERVIIDCSRESIIPKVLSMMVVGNEYWFGTQIGVLIYDAEKESVERQIFGQGGNYSLVGQYVRDLFTDRDGNIWASTLTGLKGCMNYSGNFAEYVYGDDEYSPFGVSICAAIEDRYGNIWFGSDEGKVFNFNPKTGKFRDYSGILEIPEFSAIDDLEFKGDLLCVVSYGYGLSVFDINTEKVTKLIHSAGLKNITPFPGEGFRAYLGCNDGLYYLNSLDSQPVKIEAISDVRISDISDIIEGKCWVGTYGKGFGSIDIATNTYKHYNTENNPSFVKTDFITSIRLSKDGSVWIATDGEGLGRLSIDGGNVTDVKYFGVKEGLPYDNVRAICLNSNDIWASTPNGLCQISRHSMTATGVYMQADNLVGCNFNDRTGFQASDGTMYFGTSKGLIAFKPENLRETFSGEHLIINNITTGDFNDRHSEAEAGKSVIASKTATVKQKKAPIVSFSFSTMSYGNPNIIDYHCTLKKRNFISETKTTENSINYIGLRPGKYTFTVEADGADGKVLSDSKTLKILAPWYWSKLANVIYLLMFIAVVCVGIYIYIRVKKDKFEREQKLKEDLRQKKVLQEKIDFMTNITHEIRTPISVISILVDKVFGKEKNLSPDATALKSNVSRIIGLCNELLNLRKLQDGGFAVTLHPEDLKEIALTCSAPFKEAATEKSISFVMNMPEYPVKVRCDKDSMCIILNNLLSNALKYCSSKININLSSEGTQAVIRVDSDGKHIPKDDAEKIFDAFYQSKAIDSHGTGIGLTFSKALASKNGGKLYLDSNAQDMNSFVAEFPLAECQNEEPQTVMVVSSRNQNDETEKKDNSGVSAEPFIMVVEDNDTLRGLIAEELSKSDNVITACDGKEALEMLKDNNVEIVISDIMMPRMDGCELCNAIKSSESYSHISVILLTAAVGIESHLRSLKAGADCYLEKPFNMEVLTTAINNIKINRKIHCNIFTEQPLGKVECTVTGNVEQELMNKLHDIVNDNLSHSELTTSELADLMKLPRKVLIQKLKVNTGLTINEYIRVCRLKKAAELLSENKYMIKEVAYYVGYSSSSYFAKHFTAQFGVSPSEFVQQCANNQDKTN